MHEPGSTPLTRMDTGPLQREVLHFTLADHAQYRRSGGVNEGDLP